EGFRTLGLDGSKVKYVVLSHAHGDHDGGARFVQDIFRNARMVYGAPDWDAVEKSTNRPGGKPRRDLDGTDGMRLSIGDTSVQIVTMPGHTAGTLSYLFEIKDRGRPLRAVYVGGTAIPFNADAAYYDQYLSSSRKVARAAADFGATILLSNHTEFDNGYYKAHTAANRKGTDVANPFEVGAAGVARYFAVIENCVTAARMRAAARP
ncbi:MAG: MBL fold metallo-hydrolase, partial [Vicinamibacterales bacterium]